MKTLWSNIRISDIGEILTGNTPSKKNKNYFGGKYPWIKPTDIIIGNRFVESTEETYSNLAFKKYERYLLPPGSTCVVTIGTVGEKICLTKEPSFTNQSINAIVPIKDQYDPMFIYYLMKFNLPKVAKRNPGTASGRHHVSRSNFMSMKVSVPTLKIQKKISAILAPFDDLIEINFKRIKVIENIAQNIYNEWFVNLKFPGYKNTKIMETEYGPTPIGWKWQKIVDILKLKYGKGLKKSERIQGDYPVFGSSGIIDYHNDYFIKGPTIIVGRKGNVGTIYWSRRNCNPIDTVYYVESNLSLYYLYYNLQNQNLIDAHAAVPGLNRNQVYSLPILIPNNTILKYFTNIIKPIFDFKYSIQKKNEVLIKTRDLLLPKIISGKIDVSNLDNDVGD